MKVSLRATERLRGSLFLIRSGQRSTVRSRGVMTFLRPAAGLTLRKHHAVRLPQPACGSDLGLPVLHVLGEIRQGRAAAPGQEMLWVVRRVGGWVRGEGPAAWGL